MKSNKSLVILSVILALAALFQLTFTFKARAFENEAQEFAVTKAKLGQSEKEMYRRYIDSLGNQEYYSFLGMASYSYFECKQRELNLGLDLRGGMNVILEVEKDAIIKVLANDPSDEDMIKALELTDIEVRDKGTEYVTAFVSNFKSVAKDRNMAVLFVKGNNSQIQANSKEQEVINYLRASIATAVSNVKSVVEKRINQANVTQPVVQEVEGGRISVELPGVDNPRRMEDLVEKSAQLEFYEVFTGNEAQRIFTTLTKGGALMVDSTSTSDSTSIDSAAAATVVTNPIAKILTPLAQAGSAIAKINAADRRILENLVEQEDTKNLLGPNVKIAYSAKPIESDGQTSTLGTANEYYVYFLRKDREGNAALASDDENIIDDARENTSQTGQIEVNMQMTPTAASRWAQITGSNIGKPIAIVLDNRVYSATVVNGKITNGR